MPLLSFLFAALIWLLHPPVHQQTPKAEAALHIKKLSQGNLLVMLPEDSPLPGTDLANKKYATMVKAFTENYKFSNVYFFYRVDARLLRKRDSRTRLFNKKWERVAIDTLRGKDFYISTINFTEEVDLPALAVLDSTFQHLPHPFPNPVRIYSSVPLLEVPISTAVLKLNLRLSDFAKQNQPKASSKRK
jgi:hypothetical protein